MRLRALFPSSPKPGCDRQCTIRTSWGQDCVDERWNELQILLGPFIADMAHSGRGLINTIG
jgi:hypothetical protein